MNRATDARGRAGLVARVLAGCLLVATGWFAALSPATAAPASAPASSVPAADPALEAALLRAEAIIQGKEVLGDSAFLISHGARQRGKALDLRLVPELRGGVGDVKDPTRKLLRDLQYAIWNLRDTPIPRLFYTVPPRGTPKLDPREVGVLRDPARVDARYQEQGNLVFQVMQRVLTCKGEKTPLELVGAPGYEYVSTHQLLGLLFAVQRKCLTRQATAAAIAAYAGRVRDEFELELKLPLTDLQVERAAALCLAGQCGLVPASFVRRVVEAQAAHGGWRLDDILVNSGNVSLEHTTALAYCLLAYASRR